MTGRKWNASLKVSGARTYAIKNELSRLELAMHMLVLDKLAAHGFTTITVPSLSKQKPLYGMGYLPFSQDEVYYMPADDLYLSGTAELVLNSLRADEILSENDLPVLYAGFSPCFAAKQEPLAKIRAVWFASISF